MSFNIIRQDITKIEVDAIVNAANTQLQIGGGVCRAIFNAAGAREIQAACNKVGPIEMGEAVITPGFNLPAKYVIHAAGPIYFDGKHGEEQLLYTAYMNSLKLAQENKCESIALPLISSGILGYPKEDALILAISAIQSFLEENDLAVTLVVYDKAAFAVSEKLLGDVASYIDEHYVDEHLLWQDDMPEFRGRVRRTNLQLQREMAAPIGIEDLVGNLDEPFGAMLLRLIDKKGKTDVEIYKRANLDRKLFSKIRTGKGYMPSKRTAIALAVALELSMTETNNLLAHAGYVLSHAVKFDVIVSYFITNHKYDIYEINEVLFTYDQPLLGG